MAKKSKGKTNAKKAHTGSASGNRTQKGKSRGEKKPSRVAVGSRSQKAVPTHAPKLRGHTAKRSTRASFRIKPKRTFQVTDTEAVERVTFKAGKGKKLNSSTDNAKQVLLAGVQRASKKFSRKKSSSGGTPRFSVRIRLKWKSKKGKWVSRNLVQVSTSLEAAIEKLLEHDEINSLTYERFDDEHEGEQAGIANKKKKILSVSFDKHVERKHKSGKVSKTAKAKARPKKSRHV